MVSTSETLRSATLRANPGYDLVVLDRLPHAQQEAVRNQWQGGELYGVLAPQPESSLPVKAVDHETALLFTAMRSPGALPRYVFDRLGDDTEGVIRELVLEAVLEVEVAGDYRSGAATVAELGAAPERDARGLLASLTDRALRYAAALRIEDAATLAGRLYGYHRIPYGPAWAARLPDVDAVAGWLGIEPGSRLHGFTSTHWQEQLTEDGSRPWSTWTRTRTWRATEDTRGYKLYVSTAIDDFVTTLDPVIRVLTESRARAFKFGRTPAECLRPDRLVAYFADEAELAATGRKLEQELAGCVVHGVPFTAELGLDGALSWGIDPPRDRIPTSWRAWLAERAATYLIASGDASPEDRCAYVLDRLESDGVDTERWMPRGHLFTASKS